MSQPNDGGPAFPRPASQHSGPQEGMTLREWYIGQALKGFCANPESWKEDGPKERAIRAIRQADAVMQKLQREKARSQGGD